MQVGRVSGGVVGAAPGRVAAREGFAVPGEAAGRAAQAGGVAAVSLPGLLAMQEAESGTERDRRARRHGEGLLAALRRLQAARLEGPGEEGVGEAALREVRDLAAEAPAADDPRLAAVQRAVLVRVAVELARAGLRHPRDTRSGAV